MPEGPSLVILKEEVKSFEGKKVLVVEGNSKQPIEKIQGKKLVEILTWGKHLILRFPKFSVRIHFMLFGKAAVNEKLLREPRLSLQFSKGEFNFYTCSVQFIEEPLDEVYDWSGDVLSDSWDEKAARKKLKQIPETLVADALLDQNIFAGVGNIIKNEVLYRIKVHPENKVSDLPPRKLTALIKEARKYSFDFLKWKKEFTLKKHWLAHTKKTCARDDNPIIKKHIGKTNRRTFYCEVCQVRY
ncbi:MAG: endonuclease [Flavisolibacter sp.]|nr:endonuclease [Flavisolibacter sp.]